MCCCGPACLLYAALKVIDELANNVTVGQINPEDHHSSDWVYSKLDKNGDGQVTKEEFMEMAPTILKEAMFASKVSQGQTASVPAQHTMQGSLVKEVKTKPEFDTELASAGTKLVVVDFNATWCGPCQQIKPNFEKMSAENTNVIFLNVDVDANKVFPIYVLLFSFFAFQDFSP